MNPTRRSGGALCVAVGALLLFTATMHGQVAGGLIEAAKKGDTSAVKRLAPVEDVNARGDAGLTGLMWAALYGHVDVIEALLAAGARINEVDSEKGTALGYAAIAQQTDAARLLQSRGGKFTLDGVDRFLWVLSRRSDIFDYVGARAAERKAKADAALKANWSAPLVAPADFRGTWAFDRDQSDYGKLPKPKSMTYTITQSVTEIVTDVTVDGKQMAITYALAGTDAENEIGPSGKTLAHASWDGTKVIAESRLILAREEQATIHDVWSLSGDGTVVTIDRHVTKPADGRLRLVLKRN